MRSVRLLLCAALASASWLPAQAASGQGKAKTRKSKRERRFVSKDKNFSVALPRGYKFKVRGRLGVAGWTDRSGANAMGIGALREAELEASGGSPAKATKSLRSSRAGKGSKKRPKLYKKTLPNGLVFYYFSTYGKQRRVDGYFGIGDLLYRVSGTAARGKGGLSPLFKILGTVKPLVGDKMERRVISDDSKPSALRDHEEKNTAVPLY